MNETLKFYGRLALRRAPVMLALLLICSVLGVVLALRLPTTYEATARLIVQPQQISQDLAASTVRIGALEEVRVLREQLLTRATLLELARDHDVFENVDQMLPNEIVSGMRNVVSISTGGGRGQQPVLVTIRASGRSPQVVADVVNDLVTRLTAANAELRTGAAGDTQDFFEQEVRRLATELDLRSIEITEFQSANADALPDDQDFRLQRQTLLQERRAAAERERNNLLETRRRTMEVFEATGTVGGSANRTPEERELADLERQLTRALTVYSETAPRVMQLSRRIDILRDEIAALGGGNGETSGPEALLNLQLAEIDTRIEAADAAIEATDAELERLEDAISRTPMNSITLSGLRRDYENIRRQYDNAVQALSAAAVGERIEVSARGQRVTLVEPAVRPTRPASPNRPLIAIGGFAIGMVLAACWFLLLEVLNRTVRRPAEITSKLGIAPLASVPYIESRRDIILRRTLRVASVVGVVVGVSATLWAIDTYYLPLDLLAERALDRLGLT